MRGTVALAWCLISLALSGCVGDPGDAPLDLTDRSSSDEGSAPFATNDALPGASSEDDKGQYVQRVQVSAHAENVDEDAPSEMRVSIAGAGHDEYEYYPFNGNLVFDLERNAGDYSDENWMPVYNGSVSIRASDFDDSFLPRFEGLIDDRFVINDEKYRLTFTVTVDATGKEFSDVEETLFWDDAENQTAPVRTYLDRGSEVTRITISSYPENRDGDYEDEVPVRISGVGSDSDARKFAGTATIVLERNDGDYSSAVWSRVGDWIYEFHQDNVTSSFSNDYEFIIDHDEVHPGESFEEYRITVEVVVQATETTFSDRTTTYYSQE